jgi:uncharacterized protein
MGTPKNVDRFLRARRIAVAGVSRDPSQAANVVYRKLRGAGYDVFAINPKASELEGTVCYPRVGDIPPPVEGVVIAVPPAAALELVRQSADAKVDQIWFHRSFGRGSVSEEAVQECHARNITCIVGGCPMMYCEPIDMGHRCMRWLLGLSKRVPV